MYAIFSKNGKETNYLYQWDADQVMKLAGYGDLDSTEVHFANCRMTEAVVMNGTIDEEGNLIVTVPNSLTSDLYDIQAYIYVNGGTIEEVTIPLRRRAKPAEMNYTLSTVEVTSGIATEVNAIEGRVAGIEIYGESIQDGVPTPDAPVKIESVQSISLKINVSEVNATITLRSIGEYRDRIYKSSNGIWTVERYIASEVIGAEYVTETTYNPDYQNVAYCSYPKNKDYISYGTFGNGAVNILHEKFSMGTYSATWDKAEYIDKCFDKATFYNIWFGFPKGTTLEEMKAVLEGTEIQYVLTTPTVEVLDTNTQQVLNNLITNKGINNILLTTDKDTAASIAYYAERKK